MSNGQVSNYEYISENYDLEDFYKFISFENRKQQIEKWYMDNSSADNNTSQKFTTSNPNEAYKYYQENSK